MTAIFSFVEVFCSLRRRHSSLDYLSPDECDEEDPWLRRITALPLKRRGFLGNSGYRQDWGPTGPSHP